MLFLLAAVTALLALACLAVAIRTPWRTAWPVQAARFAVLVPTTVAATYLWWLAMVFLLSPHLGVQTAYLLAGGIVAVCAALVTVGALRLHAAARPSTPAAFALPAIVVTGVTLVTVAGAVAHNFAECGLPRWLPAPVQAVLGGHCD